MQYSRIFFFGLALLMILAIVNAAPKPENFFKELEGIGQRVRDALISAGPAVDVVGRAVHIVRGSSSEEDD